MASGIALTTDETLDLWRTTLKAYEWDKPNFDYLLDEQSYPVIDQMFRAKRVHTEGGTKISRTLIYKEGGGFTWLNPGEVRTRSSQDITVDVETPWAIGARDINVTEYQVKVNANRAQLKKLVDGQRAEAVMSTVNQIESDMLGMPDVTGNKKCRSIPYYLPPITSVQAAATPAGAFQGENPPGFSDCQGVDTKSATYARLRSWNAVWDNSSGAITETCLKRMGRMFDYTHFQPPTFLTDIQKPKYSKYLLLTDHTIKENYAAAMRRGKDDLGFDPSLGYGTAFTPTGAPMFKGFPLTWSPKLGTADTINRGANPFYMLNLDYIFPTVLDGIFFRFSKPLNSVDQPDTFTNWLECWFNLDCKNRRLAGGVISYVA